MHHLRVTVYMYIRGIVGKKDTAGINLYFCCGLLLCRLNTTGNCMLYNILLHGYKIGFEWVIRVLKEYYRDSPTRFFHSRFSLNN
jgi:hypothetical protein